MASEISQINFGFKGSSFSFIVLYLIPVFIILFLLNAIVSADPHISKMDEDRRVPLKEELFGPSQDWRNPKQPNSPLIKRRTEKLEEDKGRIKSTRFKPYYYDPEKEGEDWDPYSSGSERNANPKPPTLFRFQF